MSKHVKKSSVVELGETQSVTQFQELSIEVSRCLHIENCDERIPSVMLEDEHLERVARTSDFDINVAQYEANRRKECDTAMSRIECNEDNANDLEREESFEQQYWEQFEAGLKKNSIKKPSVSASKSTEYEYTSYRKTTSKDQEERQLPFNCVFDISTTLVIEKLIAMRNLSQYHSIVGKGRDSVVVCAGKTVIINSSCSKSFINAVKVYKLSNDNIKNKALFKRTRREFEHMSHLRNNVPHPVGYSRNVIVMSFIGSDEEPALPISNLPSELNQEMYERIKWQMHWWYTSNWIVHGKLSTKSVLYWRGTLYYIGWAHSVWRSGTHALKKLMRDCLFVNNFYKARGVTVLPIEELFKFVTNLKEISREVLDMIHNKGLRKNKPKASSNRVTAETLGCRNHNRFK